MEKIVEKWRREEGTNSKGLERLDFIGALNLVRQEAAGHLGSLEFLVNLLAKALHVLLALFLGDVGVGGFGCKMRRVLGEARGKDKARLT